MSMIAPALLMRALDEQPESDPQFGADYDAAMKAFAPAFPVPPEAPEPLEAPTGFLSNLGMAFAQNPVQIPATYSRGRTSDFERFLQAALASGANTMGGLAGMREKQRQAENERRARQAAERNRQALEASGKLRAAALDEARSLAAERRRRAGETPKAPEEMIPLPADVARAYSLPEGQAVKASEYRNMVATARGLGFQGQLGVARGAGLVSPYAPVTIPPEGASSRIARRVIAGEIKLSEINNPVLRGAVMDEIASGPDQILSDKARATINEIGAARGVHAQMKDALDKLKLAEGPSNRVARGGKIAIEAMIQSNPDAVAFETMKQGFLATISRATGERGVLTDQDVARARQLLPGLFDTREVANRKMGELVKFLDEREKKAVNAYTQPMGGRAATARNAPPAAEPTPADLDYVRSLGIRGK